MPRSPGPYDSLLILSIGLRADNNILLPKLKEKSLETGCMKSLMHVPHVLDLQQIYYSGRKQNNLL